MNEIISIYFSNQSERADRLGIARSTVYLWRANPRLAHIDKIERDVRALLDLIEQEKARRNNG